MVNTALFAEHAKNLLAQGVAGLVPFGTTGEAASFSLSPASDGSGVSYRLWRAGLEIGAGRGSSRPGGNLPPDPARRWSAGGGAFNAAAVLFCPRSLRPLFLTMSAAS